MAFSPWWIAVFFLIGWGPAFLAAVVIQLNPVLEASYAPQAFVMEWIPVTWYSSILTIALIIAHAARWIFHLSRGGTPDRRHD